jgi:hypothetical protein
MLEYCYWWRGSCCSNDIGSFTLCILSRCQVWPHWILNLKCCLCQTEKKGEDLKSPPTHCSCSKNNDGYYMIIGKVIAFVVVLFLIFSFLDFKVNVKVRSRLLSISDILNFKLIWIYAMLIIAESRIYKAIQMLDLFNRHNICPVWWTGISTNDWYSNGCKLCSATHRFVSVYLWNACCAVYVNCPQYLHAFPF